MNLSKKTFTYSSILSGIIVTLITVYFVMMLPSLYVDYIRKSNFKDIKKIQESYVKDKSYNNIYTPNPSGTVSIMIPSSGNYIFVSNTFGTTKGTIKDEELIKLIDKIRYYSVNIEDVKEEDINFFNTLKGSFNKKIFNDEFPINFEFIENNNKDIFKELSYKVNSVSDDTIIYEFNSSDGINYYSTYFAMSLNKDDIIISMLPVMTPKIEEVRAIVFQSLPMIVAVSILIILVSTYYFSRKIIIPIEKLVNHATFIKNNNIENVYPIEIEGSDEIAVLGSTLNELYSKLNDSFKKLEEKNNSLIEENKRQDVFLRASSHQLKTPVAAALLLVEGMINEVGKYKNTKEHLPKVKTQLQSIRKIIDDILNLNNKNINKKEVNIEELINEILIDQEIQIKSKFINIEKDIESFNLDTDYYLIYKIIDNLITNAINYTDEKNTIKITLTEEKFVIVNYGTHIDEELLPNIFDAFVSSNSDSKGHGLGLYIVSYYSNLLGYKVTIDNIDNGVKATLYLK